VFLKNFRIISQLLQKLTNQVIVPLEPVTSQRCLHRIAQFLVKVQGGKICAGCVQKNLVTAHLPGLLLGGLNHGRGDVSSSFMLLNAEPVYPENAVLVPAEKEAHGLPGIEGQEKNAFLPAEYFQKMLFRVASHENFEVLPRIVFDVGDYFLH